MALDKKLAKESEQEDNTGLEGDEKDDLRIAVAMGKDLIDEGGIDVIDTAVKQSKDPSQVIGQFMMQMGQQLMENMPEDIQLSPKILLCPGGWVEQISDYIREEAGVKKAVMDKAEIYVATTAQEMAAAKAQQGQEAPPVPPAGGPPPMPPEGAM